MEKRQISAQIIADSISPAGKRITTFVLVFPRIILAELNTHRAFSRNSASSRAIPAKKMQDMVQKDPFFPVRWMRDHTGMQGSQYIEGNCSEAFKEIDRCFQYYEFKIRSAPDYLDEHWKWVANEMLTSAEKFHNLGVTKQITNRLLEPFMWHTALVTATDFGNFFALRAHEAAEIHLQELAYKMLAAYNESVPKPIDFGGWHIPFGDQLSDPRIYSIIRDTLGADRFLPDSPNPVPQPVFAEAYLQTKLMIATARCARVSYLNFEGKDDYEADIKLFNTLKESGHWSPFEHCATSVPYLCAGNFNGWKQLRAFQPQENKTDDRVLTKTYAEAKYHWENKTD